MLIWHVRSRKIPVLKVKICLQKLYWPEACPMVQRIRQDDISILPFQISISKRGGNREAMGASFQHNVNQATKTKFLHQEFDWGIKDGNITNDDHSVPLKAKKAENTKSHIIQPITSTMISRLGLKVLRNGKICIAGRMLDGITLTPNLQSTPSLLRVILFFFFPCLQVKQKLYQLNNKCFMMRQKKLLTMYRLVLAQTRRSSLLYQYLISRQYK